MEGIAMVDQQIAKLHKKQAVGATGLSQLHQGAAPGKESSPPAAA